jgi:hypothetical protein
LSFPFFERAAAVSRMKDASRKQTLLIKIKGHSPSPIPWWVQSAKPATAKLYITGEIEPVSRLLTNLFGPFR